MFRAGRVKACDLARSDYEYPDIARRRMEFPAQAKWSPSNSRWDAAESERDRRTVGRAS